MKSEVKRTLQIATPLILGNITQMALGLIDTAMVGAISYQQIAASALVLNLLSIPFVMGIGVTMAMSPFIAIANGKDDTYEVAHYFYNGVVLCLVIALMIAVGIFFLDKIIFDLGQDRKVAELAIPYLKIIGWSMVPMIFFLSMKQFCDALEQTKVAMFLSFVSLPINIFLNWLLIYGNWGFPRLELEGAGWATFITRIIITGSMIWVILKNKRFEKYISVRKEAWVLRTQTLYELLKIGIPGSLQYGMEVGAFAISGIIIGWFGATQQAAHQIALNMASLSFMIILGISSAGSIRVSNALGRNQILQMRNIGLSTIGVGVIFGIFSGLMMILFHNHLPLIFNKNEEVVLLAAHLLVFAAVFQISDSTQAIGVGLLRGIKDVKIPTIWVSIAYWLIGLPLGYFLSVSFNLKATGIWIGFVVGLTVSSLLLNSRFYLQSKKMLNVNDANFN